MRSCEGIARKRARQAEPPAPPRKTQDLVWWRRRFRLRILIFSQLLRLREWPPAPPTPNPQPLLFWPLALALVAAGCGYHVAGHADLVPKDIKTIAIPAFGNTTVQHKLSQLISEDLAREFVSRTRYVIVADPEQADAILQGAVTKFDSGATIIDPVSGRATGAQVIVILQVSLTDRHTGKALFSRLGYEFRERYEISIDPQAYFDESGTAITRLSRDVARSVVTAILVGF
ncbi:MAG: hypothetical protein LAQ69_12155 [Acidobacteriia bacterium]|nr:hypothetical protein [Terriglobia bacterium]